MRKILCLAGGAALMALVGCTHEAPDANAPSRPASDTMQSQTNDLGEPFLSSPKFHAPSNGDAAPNGGVDCSDPSRPNVAPCGHQDATPEPNENPMPKKVVPIAPSAP